MRSINQRFIDDLLTGDLAFFLNEVKQPEQELCLEIRSGYINIYHRGGNLLKITQKQSGYQFRFDARYCLNKSDDTNYRLLSSLSPNDADSFIKYFHLMKAEMDTWLDKHPKSEREYQHQLIRANPAVVDIEYQLMLEHNGKRSTMRLDMLAVDNGQLVIIENKYGEKAMTGNSGFAEHYGGICAVIRDKETYCEMTSSVKNIMTCKRALGLSVPNQELNDMMPPRILFLLANYNEKSNTLNNETQQLSEEYPAELLFLKNTYNIAFADTQPLFD